MLMRFTRSTWAAALVSTATFAGIAAFAGAGPALADTNAGASWSAGTPGAVAGATPSTAAPSASMLFWIVCGSSASGAILFGETLGLPARIPLRKDTKDGVFTGTVTLPASIMPGTYTPSVDCSNGVATTVRLVVHSLPTPTPTPTVPTPKPASPTLPARRYVPAAPPVTGDGTTSDAVGGPLTAVGAGLLGLGGLAGVIALWRRHPGSSA
jgi:hypothetical protein